jgi:Domain of unknown function (DUF6815)
LRVGLLWRNEWDPPQSDTDVRTTSRLYGVFSAFADEGVQPEPVVYADDRAAAVREQLLELDGVLVWVNPIEQGLDRSRLDALLREVADEGVWVSAHPDVITKIATKTVIVDTASMSWGSDSRLYRSRAELRSDLPGRLAAGPRVLKQQRGMGGQGVWRVELEPDGDGPMILVQQASRDAATERVHLVEFADRCAPYFEDGGVMVDQPFQERIDEGMIRVYLTHDTVVGFAHQYPRGLRSSAAGEPPPGKTFELPTAASYQQLRDQMRWWVPEMQHLLGVETHRLPVIWDVDFLYGPKTADGEDTYVLCEINASSTFAFPEHAMPGVARATIDQLEQR